MNRHIAPSHMMHALCILAYSNIAVAPSAQLLLG